MAGTPSMRGGKALLSRTPAEALRAHGCYGRDQDRRFARWKRAVNRSIGWATEKEGSEPDPVPDATGAGGLSCAASAAAAAVASAVATYFVLRRGKL